MYNTVVAVPAGTVGVNCDSSSITIISSNNVEYPSASCGTGVTVASGYPLSGSAPTNNGGPTLTFKLPSGGIAANSGSLSACYTALGQNNPECLVDQR
ncbi:MAG: hypothetical protein ACYDBJ_29350 [Aggregatilineales bacterium]